MRDGKQREGKTGIVEKWSRKNEDLETCLCFGLGAIRIYSQHFSVSSRDSNWIKISKCKQLNSYVGYKEA